MSQGSLMKAAVWLLAATCAYCVISGLWGMLGPFLGGIMIAYLLRPLADRLVRTGMSRGVAAALTVGGFSLSIATAVSLLVPFVWSQSQDFIISLPGLGARASQMLHSEWNSLSQHLDPSTVAQAEAATTSFVMSSFDTIGTVLRTTVTRSFAIMDVATFAVIAPLVGFYVLSEWDAIVRWINANLPRSVAPAIRAGMAEIDRTLSAWIRFEGLVCMVLAVYYATTLTVAGVHNGLLIGMLTGMCAFVPYVGFLCGLIATCLVGLFSFTDWHGWMAVATVFGIGQILDGYILTPRLVGRRIGLHDVWVVFALMAGSHLMGFIGVVIAVPSAAVIGVLVRAGMARYRASRFFQDIVAP